MLSALWKGEGKKFVVAIKKSKVQHIPVPSAGKAEKVARLLSAHQYDTYWAMAQFKTTKSRKTQNVASISSLWVDLDCDKDKPYPSWKKGLLALLAWVKKENFLPPTHIVLSGSGLHIYWGLDAAYSLDEWLPVAQAFKRVLAVSGIKADLVRTADAASILRVPRTYNWKDPANPKPVKLLYKSKKSYSLQEVKNKMPVISLRAVSSKPADVWGTPANFPPGDAELIADKCQQMKLFKEKLGAVSEPYWRAGLSVLKRCSNADYYIHEWSKGDPRYSAQETQQKAERTLGPATCSHFAEVNPDGCTSCQHKVTSPIQLGVAEEKKEEKESWRHSKINSFTVVKEGIWLQLQDAQPIKVADIPVWVVEVREKARLDTDQDQSSILLEWHTLDNRVKRGVVQQSNVYDLRAFRAWLADHNIMAAIKEVKLFVSYISQYTSKLVKEHGTKEYHEHLGWYKEGFVVGNTIVTADGPKKAMVQSSNPISRLSPQGSAKEWAKAVEVLKNPLYAPHAMALLAGFASPIYELAEVNSAVVSLVGVSGAGKTLSAMLALSIFGNPLHLFQSSTATANSIEAQLSANRHVPYLLDEVTNYPPQRLAEFIYIAANGQGKSALKRNREFKPAGSWRLTPFITSNFPLLDFGQTNFQEAHRRRLLELHFDHAMDKEDAKKLYDAMQAHGGAAGLVYLQEVCKIKDKIPKMFELAMEKIHSFSAVPDANRFCMWTLAAAIVGGTIAKKLKLIDFDIMQAIKAAIFGLEVAVEELKSPIEMAKEITQEFLTRNSKHISTWTQRNKFSMDKDAIDAPIARILAANLIAIHQSALYEEWQKNRISKSIIKKWLDSVVIERKLMRLTPNTTPVRVMIFKGEALGLDLKEEEEIE